MGTKQLPKVLSYAPTFISSFYSDGKSSVFAIFSGKITRRVGFGRFIGRLMAFRYHHLSLPLCPRSGSESKDYYLVSWAAIASSARYS